MLRAFLAVAALSALLAPASSLSAEGTFERSNADVLASLLRAWHPDRVLDERTLRDVAAAAAALRGLHLAAGRDAEPEHLSEGLSVGEHWIVSRGPAVAEGLDLEPGCRYYFVDSSYVQYVNAEYRVQVPAGYHYAWTTSGYGLTPLRGEHAGGTSYGTNCVVINGPLLSVVWADGLFDH